MESDGQRQKRGEVLMHHIHCGCDQGVDLQLLRRRWETHTPLGSTFMDGKGLRRILRCLIGK